MALRAERYEINCAISLDLLPGLFEKAICGIAVPTACISSLSSLAHLVIRVEFVDWGGASYASATPFCKLLILWSVEMGS